MEEIKPQDLRIGNLLFFGTWYCTVESIIKQENGNYCISAIDQYGVALNKSNSIDSFAPIPLTDDWFHRFNFHPHDKGGDWGFYQKLPLQISYYENEDAGLFLYEHRLSVLWVHQLQNLAFLINGEELTLKP